MAVDLSPMEPINNVSFIQSDINLESTVEIVRSSLANGAGLLARYHTALWY